ncbi:MAG: Fur family transcriptional regulator [Sporomusaceae bacterium]|nr:Fur family transcriptional regulator [Sporomusaceae bacterium]
MAVNLKDVKQIFHDKQYKLTTQRQLILQAFFDRPGQHLSAEDVFDIVRSDSTEIGLATVYRTLELLSELDFLQKIDFGDGRNRYELNTSADAHHHHHLICLTCGKVRECDDDLLESLEATISSKNNFEIVDHHVKFFGYCQECRDKRDQ